MLPLGAAPLVKLRMEGHAPAGTVWVRYSENIPVPDWHRFANMPPEIVVRFTDPVDRLDLRCVLKLWVTLYLDRYDDKAASLYARLQEYADEIVVISPDFDDDIGFWWLPRYGTLDYEKRGIVARYQRARDAVIYGSDQSARATERQLLEENPWLRC